MTEQISISVPVSGMCPAGHAVTYDLPTTVASGSSGFATCDATCPDHQQAVTLTGSYTT